MGQPCSHPAHEALFRVSKQSFFDLWTIRVILFSATFVPKGTWVTHLIAHLNNLLQGECSMSLAQDGLKELCHAVFHFEENFLVPVRARQHFGHSVEVRLQTVVRRALCMKQGLAQRQSQRFIHDCKEFTEATNWAQMVSSSASMFSPCGVML